MDNHIFRVVTDLDRSLPVYVTNTGGWYNQSALERDDDFPDFQWIQTVEGAGQLLLGDEKYTVGPSQGMLLYPHVPHRYAPLREPWTVRWVAFNGKQLRELLRAMDLADSRVLYLTHPALLLNRLHAIASVSHSKDPSSATESSTLAYQLLLDLYLYGSSSEIRSKQQHYEQMAPVFSYIAEHHAEPLTLQMMAAQLGVTVQHTCLLFQQTVGMRPFAYLTLYRLRKAKELLLEEPGLEVREVARRVGYEDTSYFIKRFKQQEGITPSRFRKIHLQGEASDRPEGNLTSL